MTNNHPPVNAWDLYEGRRAVIDQYRDPDNQERFNNYRYITMNLWSEGPQVDRLVTKLSLMMWSADHQKRHDNFKVVLLNLLKIYDSDPSRYLGYHRNNNFYTGLKARFNPAGISRLVNDIIDSLAKEDLVENHQGRYWRDLKMGYISKVRTTKDLIDLMTVHGVTPDLITRHPDTEVIILKGPKTWKHRGGRMVKVSGQYQEYNDTQETGAMRERLVAYNQFMAGVTLEYDGAVIPIGPTRRIFNGSWDQGGRFYGGFWQSLSKDKRSTIKLNGEPVIELDYGSLHTHLLYCRTNATPEGDLYDLPGVSRKVAKRAVLLMIGSRRRSNVIRNLESFIRAEYPKSDLEAKAVTTALEDRHKPLENLWYNGRGLDLQHQDSLICGRILTTLTAMGIPCLSLYDSFIVPERYEECLRGLMVACFREITGVAYDPPID